MVTGVMQLIVDARSRVGTATAAETAEKLRAGTAVVVDVRQPSEWEAGHIDGSVPAPRGLLEFFADPASPRHAEALEPERPTIVVCHSGARAALAAATLQDMGYDDVSVLDGGVSAWVEAGLPLTEHVYAGL